MKVKGERLRLLWSDLHGLERGKYLLGDWAERSRANFCITTFPLTLDKEILPIPGLAFDVGLPDVEAHLDHDSLRRGWEPDTVVGLGDLEFRGERVAVDSRDILRRAVEPWTAQGLIPQLAYEYEFYVLEPDGNGGWRSIHTPGARVYGTGMAVDPSGVVDDVVRAAVACGFPVEGWGSEFDTAQFEVNLRYDDAMKAADDAFLFRVLTREVAARHGLLATFIGRPFDDRGGSGLHLNISFRSEKDGSNALNDPKAPDGLSTLARRCVAGMLAHHEGLAAICAPTVNAYKRLQPDMLNGYWANWGHDDRTVAVRISPDRGTATRMENRVPDGAANPYLTAAALLHACRLGVEAEADPPPPQPTGADPNTEVRIPPSLEKALDAFEADKELGEALGPDVATTFTMLKRAEWGKFVDATPDPSAIEVTDWELRQYLPYF